MLTPKCPPRDFRVSARGNSTKNRLSRLKRKPKSRNLAGIREEFGSLARARKFFYINDLGWLCCEAAADESLQPNSLIRGKIQGISLETSLPACTKP